MHLSCCTTLYLSLNRFNPPEQTRMFFRCSVFSRGITWRYCDVSCCLFYTGLVSTVPCWLSRFLRTASQVHTALWQHAACFQILMACLIKLPFPVHAVVFLFFFYCAPISRYLPLQDGTTKLEKNTWKNTPVCFRRKKVERISHHVVLCCIL